MGLSVSCERRRLLPGRCRCLAGSGSRGGRTPGRGRPVEVLWGIFTGGPVEVLWGIFTGGPAEVIWALSRAAGSGGEHRALDQD